MATRMFTVDFGAWSVKLAIATPGIRGATMLNVACCTLDNARNEFMMPQTVPNSPT